MAQEDLWVYEALVRIIRNTNEGCTRNHNAVVKQIEALEIAQDAVASSLLAEGKVVRLPAASTPAAAAAELGPMSEIDPQAAMAEPLGGGAETDLLAGRYVTPEGKPLAAGEKPPFAEYKIMPICMKLTINQTKIPKLLVECANSSMPIEVRRVRIRPGEGADALDLSQVTAGDAAAAAAGEAHPPTPHRLGAAALPKSLSGDQQAQVTEKDIPVEIHGFIYIYNEPDHEKLGTGAVAEEAATTTAEGPSEAAPGEQPATTPKPPGETPQGGAAGQGPAGGQPPAGGG